MDEGIEYSVTTYLQVRGGENGAGVLENMKYNLSSDAS
jgi:hypothetical protein